MIGKTISHYKILEKLGGGGMGVVYKAQDIQLDRFVALKFLPPELTRDKGSKERFILEAKAASALDHNNICTIHEIGNTEEDQLFIAMAYYDGETLKKKIEKGPLKIEETIGITLQTLEGLVKAHNKNITHRDIKPANIFITNDGIVKILDFGLAKVIGQTQLTQMGSTVGTVAYMSPEQTRGEKVDNRTDIWSLGVMLYEMMTGQQPFKGDYEQAIIYSILNEDPTSISSLRPEVPETLQRIAYKAMARNLNERFSSVEEMLQDMEAIARPGSPVPVTLSRFLRKPIVVIPAIVILLTFTAGLIWWLNQQEKVQWARKEVLPQIEILVEKMRGTERTDAWEVFELSQQIEDIIPDDPLLKRLQPRYSRKLHIYSQPAGTRLYAKSYADSGQAWRYIGQTPLDSVLFPLGFSRVKVEKEGYRNGYDLLWNGSFLSDTVRYALADSSSVPHEMEFIPNASSWFEMSAAPAGLHMPGLEHHPFVPVGDFFMDRYEVTNAEYKQFINADGYLNRVYWKHPFQKDGRELTWQQARDLMIDKTGQLGPATWEVGDYPEGQAHYPVSGISWYEASAYAEFVGKRLPTVYHWDRVSFTWASSAIVPHSNLSRKGMKPVGHFRSMNRFGIFDLAGNAREWCVNQSSRGGYFILGGGWNDPAYAFNDAYAQDPFDRSETNGFRCIRYLQGESNHVELQKTIKMPFRDFLSEQPVSDATFKLFLRQYEYDQTPLNTVIESVQEEEEYIRQKITFDAAYGNERMMAYLFLPQNTKPPFQTVIYFPGSGAIHARSSEELKLYASMKSLLKSGRVVMYPIYKSTFERGDDLHSDYPDMTNFWKDHVIMWAKDFRRSIDYLETRGDIDSEKFVYYGASWGGAMGGIIPAVEPRLNTTILLVAGLLFQPSLPEVDPVNFLPRITMPVLMLNGKYDFFFPYDTSQKPFFELLGTSPNDKRIFLYERGHSVPQTELVKEMLTWLNHYLGPVLR